MGSFISKVAATQSGVVLGGGLFAAFVLHRFAPRELRMAGGVGVASMMLCHPLDRELYPPYHATTMMHAVICFMCATKALQYTLLDEPRPRKQSAITGEMQTDSISLLPFFLEFASFLFPLRFVPSVEREALSDRLKKSALDVVVGSGKILLNVYLVKLLRETMTSENVAAARESYPTYMLYSALFGASVLTAHMGFNDFMAAVTRLVSGGMLDIRPFNNWVLLSTSLRDFWGRRYNLLIHRFMHESIFTPMVSHNCTPSTAALSSFALSGILHAYVAHCAFGGGEARSLVYFLLLGGLCTLEPIVMPRSRPVVLRWVWTQGVSIALLPIYVGLFVDAMPMWMENNPTKNPEIAERIVDELLNMGAEATITI